MSKRSELVMYVKPNGAKIRINPNQPLIQEKILELGWENWEEKERERIKEEVKTELKSESKGRFK